MAVINLPKLGLTMTQAVIAKWLKKEGETITKGEPIVEFETDKISHEYESPEEGCLLKILVPEGEEVEVASPICIIGRPGENTEP